MKFRNTIIHVDCTQVLKDFPDSTADLVITDPPYLVNYRDRQGRTVRNDAAGSECLSAFAELFRVPKPDSLCVCFYGRSRTDQFFQAWRAAGFRPVCHIVWHKDYASQAAFVEYRHEQAYVLAKGNPRRPANPIADVQPWTYSGNRAHPTEKSVSILQPLVKAFSKPATSFWTPLPVQGAHALRPPCRGSGLVGIELEQRYCRHAGKRLTGTFAYVKQKAA